MKQLYDRAWQSIINPTKFIHKMSTLCPKIQNINDQILQRIDYDFKNSRGNLVSVVIFKQSNIQPENTILYLHGNGGSKMQALGFMPLLCHYKTALISFDFVGCGNSEEGFLTYGVNQSKDAQEVLSHAKQFITIDKLTIWGRSMGAVTSIMFAQRNRHIIDAMILDCPFVKLSRVVQRVIQQQIALPYGIISIIRFFLSKEIKKRLNYEIFEINYLSRFKNSCKNIPILFLYSKTDTIVPQQEVLQFFNACQSDKKILQISSDHQQQRSVDILEAGLQWIQQQKKQRKTKLKLCYIRISNQYESPKPSSLCCGTHIL